MLGTPIEMTRPFEARTDFHGPTEPHWMLTLSVDQVVPNSATTGTRAVGNPLPSVIPGRVLQVAVFEGRRGVPIDKLRAVVDAGSTLLAFINGDGDPDDAASEGYWFVQAIATSTADSVNFLGGCGSDLAAEFEAVADAMGRQADTTFLVDFQAEVLEPGTGPIEETSFDLYDQ